MQRKNFKQRIISFILVSIMIIGLLPVLTATVNAKDETTIKIGDYIILGKYYNEPILWRCADISDKGTLMLSDKILCLKAYDANGNSDFHYVSGAFSDIRKQYGSNCWEDSNLRQWLNSNEMNVNWTHDAPTQANVYGGYNPYDNETGFLSSENFTVDELDVIKPFSRKVYVNRAEVIRGKYDGGTTQAERQVAIPNLNWSEDMYNFYYRTLTDKMFILGPTEAYSVYNNLGMSYVSAKPTSKAITNSTYKNTLINVDTSYNYWLNYIGGSGVSYEWIETVGNSIDSRAWNGCIGVRPAFYLDVENFDIGFGTGSETSPYIGKNAIEAKPEISTTISGDSTFSSTVTEQTLNLSVKISNMGSYIIDPFNPKVENEREKMRAENIHIFIDYPNNIDFVNLLTENEPDTIVIYPNGTQAIEIDVGNMDVGETKQYDRRYTLTPVNGVNSFDFIIRVYVDGELADTTKYTVNRKNDNNVNGLEMQTTLKIEVGETDSYFLTAYLQDEDIDWGDNGTNRIPCTWTSSDTSVVQLQFIGDSSDFSIAHNWFVNPHLEEKGSSSVPISGVGVGTATITVRLDNGNEVSCGVTVTEKTDTSDEDDVYIKSEDNKNRVLNWYQYFKSDVLYLNYSSNFMSTHYYLTHDSDPLLLFAEMATVPLYNGKFFNPIYSWKYGQSNISIEETENILIALLEESEDFYQAYTDKILEDTKKLVMKAYLDGLKLYAKSIGKDINILLKNVGLGDAFKGINFSEFKDVLIAVMPSNEKSNMKILIEAFELSQNIKNVFDEFNDFNDILSTVKEFKDGYQKAMDKVIEIESLKKTNEVYIEALEYISMNCGYSVVSEAAQNLSDKISNEMSLNILEAHMAVTVDTSGKLINELLDTVIDNIKPLKILKKGMDYGVLLSNICFHTKDIVKLHDSMRSMFWISMSLNMFSIQKGNEFLTSQTEENATNVVAVYQLLWKCRATSENLVKNICEILKSPDGLNVINISQKRLDIIKQSLFEDTYEYLKEDSYAILAIAQCPVDMEILDKNGNIVMILADGSESETYNNLGTFFVYKDSISKDYIKMAQFITDSSYNIRLKGKADGSVSFSLSGYDTIKDEIINYSVSHIPVSSNTTITADTDINNIPILNILNNGVSSSVQMEIDNSTGYVPVERLDISNRNNISIKIGEKKIISAQTIPANATDQLINWTSSNPNIVSAENSVIIGKSIGTAVVTAKSNDGDKTITININVTGNNNSNTYNNNYYPVPNSIQVSDDEIEDKTIPLSLYTKNSGLTEEQKKLLTTALKNSGLISVGLGIYITVPTEVEESKPILYVKVEIDGDSEIDPTKITYYRLNNDGTFTPVPTVYNSKTNKIIIYANKSGVYVSIINKLSFDDVKETDWFHGYVYGSVNLGIVNGRNKKIFDPLTSASIADTVVMLFRAMGISQNVEGKNDDWSKPYIDKAVALGIYDNKWKSNDVITREKMAMIVANSFKMLGISKDLTDIEIDEILKNFIDKDKISIDSKKAMAICVKEGLIIGVNEKILTIDPQGNFTRAQMSTIAVRFRKLFIDKIKTK